MSDIAIEVENLSKVYRIGVNEQTNETLMGMMGSMIKSPFANFRKLRNLSHFSSEEGEDVIWSLRDVSFKVDRGEVLGIIGQNGAGKSTLLKVLSRITDPSHGRALIHGRVASLLEVGTGFHPDLTGRENLYLNGTILGMKKKEIDQKYDEIVEFSGVRKFIDTPVKRYSSGMRVRLAFSVAAHLEPEILVVDEVLAVGDAEFQQKCLGKMKTVASSGRTVLFVSHNMGAIQNLCTKVAVLRKGQLLTIETPQNAIGHYLGDATSSDWVAEENEKNDYSVNIRRVSVSQDSGQRKEYYNPSQPVDVEIEYDVTEPTQDLLMGFDVISSDGVELYRTYDLESVGMAERKPGRYISRAVLPPNLFQSQIYFLELLVAVHRLHWINRHQVRLKMEFEETRTVDVTYAGSIQPQSQWHVERQ